MTFEARVCCPGRFTATDRMRGRRRMPRVSRELLGDFLTLIFLELDAPGGPDRQDRSHRGTRMLDSRLE